MIEFKCPTCSKFLRLPHSYAGKQTECPGCLKQVTVPGGPAPAAPGTPPATPGRAKHTTPARSLCVDCGQAFPTGQLMEHTGQLVCTDCYHKRKPIVLKPRKRRGKGRRRKVVLLILLVLAAAAGAWAVWHYVIA